MPALERRDPVWHAKLWNRFAVNLAMGLVSFQFAFDPECIVLGGGVSSVRELLLEAIRRDLPEQDRYIRLLLADLIEAALLT